MLPFKETSKENYFIREFSEDTSSFEFVWHRDKEDRYIEPIHTTDWTFQLDNQLPVNIDKKIFIPKETYNRLNKGTGDLKLKIYKL